VSYSEDDQLTGWQEGEILQDKGDFFLVILSESRPPEIVARERLRPSYGHTLAIFEKVLIPIKPELQVCLLIFFRGCVREDLNDFQADVKVTEDTLDKVAKLVLCFREFGCVGGLIIS
jgi:hypothetical protein